MSKSTKHHAFEEKARRMAEGFRGMPANTTELVFRSESMVPMQAAARLQGMLESFQGVRDADEHRQTAQEALDQAMPNHLAFYEEAVAVVRSHFGSDAQRLAAFGLESTKKGHRRGAPSSRGSGETVRAVFVEEVTQRDGDSRMQITEVEEVDPVRERRPPRERGTRRAARATAAQPMEPVIPPAAARPPAKRRGGHRR